MRAERTAARLAVSADDGVHEFAATAAVFDCDGLLMDSESVWVTTLGQWLSDHRLDPSAAESFLGLAVDETCRRLVSAAPEGTLPPSTDAATLAADLADRYSADLTASVPPMPGAVELIRALSGHVPIAVASNGHRADVRRLLTQAGILPMVDAVCTIEDVDTGKPAPDLYLTAVGRLDRAPAGVVAFEDSPAGASAARTAGLTVVGVNADAEIALDVDHRLRSLGQVSVIPQRPHRTTTWDDGVPNPARSDA